MTTWDEKKRKSNFAKHGVDLALAEQFDLNAAVIEEDRDVGHEQRFRAIGFVEGKLFFLVFTLDDAGEPHVTACGARRRKKDGNMQRKHNLTSDELAEIARRRTLARAKAKQLIKNADPDEDAAILAAAEAGPDALPMTDEQLARMRPAHEVLPHLVARMLRRGRPKLDAPKQQVTLRLDADVLDHFKEGGSGWQTAINDTLRKAIGRRKPVSPRALKGKSARRKVS